MVYRFEQIPGLHPNPLNSPKRAISRPNSRLVIRLLEPRRFMFRCAISYNITIKD